MCNDGINHAQLQMAIEMAEQQTALAASWMKEIAHLAGHAHLAEAEIAEAETALKTARRSLEDAADAVKAGPTTTSYEVNAV